MASDKNKAYLLLGANLGEREKCLLNAVEKIEENVGVIISQSSIYETEAWGKTDQPSFLNLALIVETNLSPQQLLEQVLTIEQSLGRIRHEKWGARLIDIDIIFYGSEVIDDGAKLQIPHSELQNRKFVLQPLAEIAPDFIHPVLLKKVSEILENLTDSLTVKKR